MEWSTACPDWERRIVEGRSLVPCGPLFPAEAAAGMAIFRDLRIVDAPGRPTIGESCRPFVFDFAEAVFGAYDPNTGRRLIRYFFELVSKKNSKSTKAAAIMLTTLLRNWRDSAEFLVLAPTLEVAGNSFIPARDMIRHDERLEALIHIQEHQKMFTHRLTGATLKVVAADDETVSGKKTAGLLVDELWLFGKRPRAEGMLREVIGGFASRPEAFVIYLSTQSDEPPAGVFKQQLDEFRAVRDGRLVDPKSMGILYEFPPAMVEAEAFRNPKNFYVTNPNLDVSVDMEFLVDELAKAERAGREAVAGFFAKHLNVEIGMSLRSNRWPGAEYWARRADPTITVDSLLQRCEVIIAGVDGGGLDDLFGLCLLGREKRTRRWLAWFHGWAHTSVLERRKSIATVLQGFVAAEELTIVDDELGDIEAIVAIVERVKTAGLLGCVAVDPAGLGGLVDALDVIGVTEDSKLLVGVGQGYRMMNALKTGERKLVDGTLWHCGSKAAAWCVGNLKIEPTATAIRATKQNAGDAKIDLAMSLFDAIDQMQLNPNLDGGRALEEAIMARGGFA